MKKKCSACGFETPEEQGWCDFCKEPFRKAAAEPKAEAKPAEAPQPQPAPAPKPQPAPVAIPPQLFEELRKSKERNRSETSKGIPPEFAHLDAGENIQAFSPYIRKLAWAFLAFCVGGIILATVLLLAKARDLNEERSRTPARAPAAAPSPEAPAEPAPEVPAEPATEAPSSATEPQVETE